MTDLSNLGKALTAVFVVSLVALLAELFYVLWRRRVFRQQSPAVHGGDHPKDLLYFLCWKHRSRIEPDGRPAHGSDGSSPDAPPEVIDMLMLQRMYGPSRVLFTIKEEEREDVDSEKSLPSADKGLNNTKRVSLEECFGEVAGGSQEVGVTIDVEGQTTPFLTPCGSPLYYTPTASPSREGKESPGNKASMDGNRTGCLEVDGEWKSAGGGPVNSRL